MLILYMIGENFSQFKLLFSMSFIGRAVHQVEEEGSSK